MCVPGGVGWGVICLRRWHYTPGDFSSPEDLNLHSVETLSANHILCRNTKCQLITHYIETL